MIDLPSLLLSPKGRATRREFWIGAAALMLASIGLGMVPILGPVATLALLYPWTCLAMRRLEDMGRPPRLALVPIAICSMSGILGVATMIGASQQTAVAATLMLAGVTLLVSSITALVAAGFILWLGLSASRPVAPSPAPLRTVG